MYDIDIKNVKKGKKFNWIFIGAGLIFLVIMLAIFFSSIFARNSLDAETQSIHTDPNRHEDSDGDTVYSPIFTYEVDGKQYTCASGVSSSIGPGEEPRTIHYNSKNPSECMSDYSENINWLLIIFAVLPAIFITLGAVWNHKISKRVKQIEALNQTGKLVKNLPYRLESSNIEVNGHPIMKIVVDYHMPNGQTVTLEGDPRYDRKESDEDGRVDLVIDESDPKNYYLDFEINRISGNRSDDYYVDPNEPSAPSPESTPAPEPTPTSETEPASEPAQSEPNIPPAIKI